VRLPAEAGEGRDKIQLRFQKRSLAAEEPANFDDAPFLPLSTKQFDINMTQKRTKKVKSQICPPVPNV
jgi:hypothetical protein